jgi:hypothetical protein
LKTAAKIGQLEFLHSFEQETQAVRVNTDCGMAVLNQPQVVKARTGAQVPHFRDWPIGRTLRSASC